MEHVAHGEEHMNPDIERELRDYLRAQKESDAIGTQKRLADWAIQHDADDKVRHTEVLGEVRSMASELRGDIRGLSLRVGKLEKSDEKLEDKLEQSGSWEREALQAQVHKAHESGTWMKRQGLAWLIGGLGAAMVMVVNILVAWAMRGK